MKHLLRLLIVLSFCSIAHAQDLRFGVRFGLDATSALGMHFRADFDGLSDGFGVRVIVGSTVILNTAEVMAYYRFSSSGTGSSAYVGAGGGLLVIINLVGPLLGNAPITATPYVAGLLGYEYAFSEGFSLFFEIRPIWLVAASNVAIFPLIGLGLNVYL